MFNFGKKKNTITDKSDETKVRLLVIPEIFYGGKDPLIYNEPKPVKIEKKKIKEKELKKEEKVKIITPFSKTKVVVIVLFFLLVGSGVGAWYYMNSTGMTIDDVLVKVGLKKTPTPPAPLPTPPKLPPTPPAPVLPPAPTEIEPPVIELVTTSTEARPLTFPRVLLADSADLDKDGMTDLEEEVMNTDSGTSDSDSDGYFDGQEVFNLYNPTGFAPVKIIDSGLVREYINPTWKYRVYYPAAWQQGSVDEAGDHVLFSAINGDFIEIRKINNDLDETFTSWFAKNIAEQRFTDLVQEKNRFGIDFYKRSDSLVAYFVGKKAVFVMIYQPANNAESLSFRHLMQLMYQSFRLSDASNELPGQTVLPVPNQ